MAQIWLTNTHPVTRASTGGKLLFCRAAVVSRFLGLSCVALPPRPGRSTRPSPLNRLRVSAHGRIVLEPGQRELRDGTGGLSTSQQSFFLVRDPAQVHSTFLLSQGEGGQMGRLSEGGRVSVCAGRSCGSAYSAPPPAPPPPTNPCNPKGSLNLKLPFLSHEELEGSGGK